MMFNKARLEAAVMRIRYILWKIINPGKKFSDYYIKQVARTLDNKEPHPTLGCAKTDQEIFDRSGVIHLQFLIDNGLSSSSKVVDYGCGSLRVGRKLIEYLESNHYFGFDITDRYFLDGLAGIEPELIKDKNPQFFIISVETLREVGARNSIDIIVSTGVLIHVPKNELRMFFERIISLMDEQTKAYIYFQEAGRYIQTGPVTWLHSAGDLRDLVEELGCKCRFTQDKGFLAMRGRKTENHKILVLSRGPD